MLLTNCNALKLPTKRYRHSEAEQCFETDGRSPLLQCYWNTTDGYDQIRAARARETMNLPYGAKGLDTAVALILEDTDPIPKNTKLDMYRTEKLNVIDCKAVHGRDAPRMR